MKKKQKQKKKKTFVAALGVFAVILIAAASIYIYTAPKVTLIKDSFSFEYGQPVEISVREVFESSDDQLYDTATMDLDRLSYKDGNDYPEVGEYAAQVSYVIRGKTYTQSISIDIADQTAPVFTKFKDLFEIWEDSKKPDYASYFDASDLSEVTISIDDTDVNYAAAGDYKIAVKATDVYGNEVSKEAAIKIKATSGISPYYVNGILVVNKKNPLPSDYAPGEDATAGTAVRRLIADMQKLGFSISNSYSGYRSYSTQARLYANYVDRYGQAKADTFSARAGYSEHQTGLAFDLLNGSGALIKSGTGEAEWIATNAHRYGFIVRYLEGKESITGYIYEPWHLRYIGEEATQIYNSGKTLEEYLGVEGGGYL